MTDKPSAEQAPAECDVHHVVFGKCRKHFQHSEAHINSMGECWANPPEEQAPVGQENEIATGSRTVEAISGDRGSCGAMENESRLHGFQAHETSLIVAQLSTTRESCTKLDRTVRLLQAQIAGQSEREAVAYQRGLHAAQYITPANERGG